MNLQKILMKKFLIFAYITNLYDIYYFFHFIYDNQKVNKMIIFCIHINIIAFFLANNHNS